MVWILLSLAFLLLADRKIWAGVQMRKGPNVVGPFGLLQSFADFLKFVLKEIVVPAGADKAVFLLAPLISFILAFGAWAVIPLAPGWVVSEHQRRHPLPARDLLARRLRHHHGRLGVELEVSVPGRRCVRRRRWSSYEVSIGFIIITVILLAGTMNLQQIVEQPGRRLLELERLRRPAASPSCR